MPISIYVLKCESDKFYIGRTTQPNFRIDKHFKGNGAAWTTMYPPKEVVHVEHNADPFDEDKFVKIYMKQYGIDNVRGGSYSQIKLGHDIVKLLEKELLSSDNRCYRCHEPGHYVRFCPRNRAPVPPPKSLEFPLVCEICEEECKNKTQYKNHDCTWLPENEKPKYVRKISDTTEYTITSGCNRCGRNNHETDQCYAKRHINGTFLG